MKVAIIGSRNLLISPQELRKFIDEDCDIIISGGAIGVDSCAAEFARVYNLELIIFKPDWKLYGKSAGFIRNRLIIDAADKVVAFWDGISKGTKHSIDISRNLNKSLKIYLSEMISIYDIPVLFININQRWKLIE